MTEYFIARHGQSEWNLLGRIQGQTNNRLSLLGLRQSQDLSRVLADQPLTDIFTSKLDRSIQTAQPLARDLKLPIQSTGLLNELAFGTLEGKYLRDLDSEDQMIWDWWMADPVQRAIPGGESYQDLFDRIVAFLAELSQIEKPRSILIIGHLRVNQVLLGCLLELSLRESITIHQPNNWLYHYSGGSQISGAEFPPPAGRKLDWKPGLYF